MPQPHADVRTASEALLILRVDISDDTAVVTLAGECDASVARRLAQALREARDGAIDVQLDLRELTFLDSATLQVLYQENIRHETRGSKFVLVDPQPGIRRVLEI